MIDASIALGLMTFNTMGTVFVLATLEYIKVRRELGRDRVASRATRVAQDSRHYVPVQA